MRPHNTGNFGVSFRLQPQAATGPDGMLLS